MKRAVTVAILGATLVASAANLPAKERCGAIPAPDPLDPESLRALVVFHAEREAEAIAAARSLGANAVVTHSAPDEGTAALARAAGVGYVAFLSTAEIDRAWDDPALHARYAAMKGVGGVYFEDEAVLEGYTSVDDQARAYRRLKELFPHALAIHPTRLDPILFDAGYLDAIYRPELTDVVTPYYYPVGTTLFGWFSEGDDWKGMLEPMLRELAAKTPAGKPVLPVLQGFEQEGFPVGAAFVAEQFDVYRRVWPRNDSAAVFEWGDSRDPSPESPLVGLAFRPELVAGTRQVFRAIERADAAASCAEKRTDPLPPRGGR